MLIEFYGRNFGCFRDEFRLSMLATDIDPDSKRGIVEVKVEGDDEPLELLRCAAIYGPNASGKSTLMRAAMAFYNLLQSSRSLSSDAPLRDYDPFVLGKKQDQPVMLGLKGVIDDNVYDYCIEFNRSAFVSEQLTRLNGPEPEVLLERTKQAATGSWENEPQFELIAKSFRPNALLLSLADSLAPTLAKGICVGLLRLLTIVDQTSGSHRSIRYAEEVARRASKDNEFSNWLLNSLRWADVGVTDLSIKPRIEIRSKEPFGSLDSGKIKRKHQLVRVPMLILHHSGEEGALPLPYSRESLGTRRMAEMSPILFDLGHGEHFHTVFVDEFDASMHPVLLQSVVHHFNCEIPTEEMRGQLVFAVHETSLMEGEAKDAILRRDQVWFTEKDSTGASRLYSLAKFKERQIHNIRRRYLQGRYGALPAIGTLGD